MQTNLSESFLATSQGQRANEILRACVHCGFCNATCPTYGLTGDELDGPRGRIYLIKELLESGDNEERATRHLDRCLTCRACETTCPSGVRYGELAEIARNRIGPKRSGFDGKLRSFLRWLIPDPKRLRRMSALGRMVRWLLPRRLAKQVPRQLGKPAIEAPLHERRVLLLNGCAQQVATPGVNTALARLLEARGISVVTEEEEQCCGSLDLHLGDDERALARVRRNVDAFHARLLEVEAIVSTASGCGVTVKDYDRLLADEPDYAERARAVAAATMDAAEFIAQLDVEFDRAFDAERIAWHAPCTLQHGQRLSGVVESILQNAGYELVAVKDRHLCCGSAGTYSVLQPDLAEALREQKLAALSAGAPDVIATANVGCQTHLDDGSSIPVVHWLELLA